MYDHLSFLIFLKLLIKPSFQISNFLKWLYFSVPKLSRIGIEIIWIRYHLFLFIEKPESNRNWLIYFWRISTKTNIDKLKKYQSLAQKRPWIRLQKTVIDLFGKNIFSKYKVFFLNFILSCFFIIICDVKTKMPMFPVCLTWGAFVYHSHAICRCFCFCWRYQRCRNQKS